jgi:hypothetical protein
MEQTPSKLTPLGRLISLVLVVGLIGGGVYMVMNRLSNRGGVADRPAAPAAAVMPARRRR